MRRILIRLALCLSLLPAVAAADVLLRPAYPSAESFVEAIEQLQNDLNASNLAAFEKSMPGFCAIETPEGTYDISNTSARTLNLEETKARLSQLAAQVKGYAAAPAPGTESRKQLERILARPEFAPDAPDGEGERLRKEIARWIAEFFGRLFNIAEEHPNSGRVLFWLLLVAALAALAILLLRLRNRGVYLWNPAAIEPPAGPRTWEQGLAVLRASLASGDRRRVILYGYWTAVARLQESKALPTQAGHTPREFLRALRYPPAAPHLKTMTRLLERHWYAGIDTAGADVSLCLASLKELGCPLD